LSENVDVLSKLALIGFVSGIPIMYYVSPGSIMSLSECVAA